MWRKKEEQRGAEESDKGGEGIDVGVVGIL